MMNNAENPQLTIPRVIGCLSFFNADNLEIMRGFADNEFDLAIVDPPYGINICYSPDGKKIVTDRKTKKGKYTYLASEKWDTRPKKEYFEELFRVSKNQIIWGGNFFVEHLPPKQCWIVWDKMNGNSSFSDCELAFTSFDLGLRICRCYTEKTNKIHITQKPIKLYDWIIERFCKANMKILDTNLGSGSIAIAIEKANRLDKMNLQFVGIEIDKEYFEKALNRIEQYCRQGTLSF